MGCEYCDIVERNSRAQILHEDDSVAVAAKDLVLIPGQITIFPKKHFTILEEVPDDILLKCSVLADKVSRAVFESLDSQGTNILVHNGLGAGQKVPHFGIEVIPRRESDGLNLQWPPKEVPPEELEIIAAQLQEEIKKPDISKKDGMEKEQLNVHKAEAVKTEPGKDNYLVKSLRRIP